jgi:hypothetical protein
MHQTNSPCFTRTNGSSVVLLARIVDGAGRPIQPSQVAAIEYSVVIRGACRSEARLVVSDVLSPTLVNDDSWTVDVAGYNFRHSVSIGDGIRTPRMRGPIELRYVFSRIDNTKSIIRFHLSVV